MKEPLSNEPAAEIVFEGVGHSVDAAVLDALAIAGAQKIAASEIKAQVVDWGVRVTGLGGARSFWARVRVIE